VVSIRGQEEPSGSSVKTLYTLLEFRKKGFPALQKSLDFFYFLLQDGKERAWRALLPFAPYLLYLP